MNILILDFGFYAENNPLRPAITALSRDAGNEIMPLDVDTMNEDAWDVVLDKLLHAERCITL